MGKSTDTGRSQPSRRSVLAGLAASTLGGCATGADDPELATAVIGLRIEDTPALQAARAGYRWSVPTFSFGLRNNDPTANLTFGLVDPISGAIDLPMFAGLQGVRVQVDTDGYATTFESARLVPGRYATLQAHFRERPDSSRQLIRVLEFSGGSTRFADADEVKGFGFTVAAGETVYVGTVVLSLANRPNGKIGYAPPRIEDEFAAASAVYPVLAGLGAARGSRLMTLFGVPSPSAPPTPRYVPRIG